MVVIEVEVVLDVPREILKPGKDVPARVHNTSLLIKMALIYDEMFVLASCIWIIPSSDAIRPSIADVMHHDGVSLTRFLRISFAVAMAGSGSLRTPPCHKSANAFESDIQVASNGEG